jgi:hypothetical protein
LPNLFVSDAQFAAVHAVAPLAATLAPLAQNARPHRGQLTVIACPARQNLSQATRYGMQHQTVFEADQGFGGPRVTLARAAASQLAVHTPAAVAQGQYDVQAAGLPGCRIQTDVRAATGHVGRHRDSSGLTSTRHLCCLIGILHRIQNLMT